MDVLLIHFYEYNFGIVEIQGNSLHWHSLIDLHVLQLIFRCF